MSNELVTKNTNDKSPAMRSTMHSAANLQTKTAKFKSHLEVIHNKILTDNE